MIIDCKKHNQLVLSLASAGGQIDVFFLDHFAVRKLSKDEIEDLICELGDVLDKHNL